MRPRRWILALPAILALLILGCWAAWRVLDLETALRRMVVERMTALGLERVELAEARLAWLGVDLRRVGATLPGGGLRLEARLVRLRLSPLAWLKSPAQALAALERVELRHFTLVGDQRLLHRRPPADAGHRSLRDWLRSLSPTLAVLPQIHLSRGRLVWRDGGTAWPLVEDLEGLAIRHSGRLEVLLRSRLLENRHQAFHADLNWDPATLDGRFHLRLDSLRQRLRNPPWWRRAQTLEWSADLALGGHLRGGVLDSLSGGGLLLVRELQWEGWAGAVAADCRLDMDRDSLRATRGELRWRDQRVTFAAALPWRLEGGEAWLDARGLDLGALQAGPREGRRLRPLAGSVDLRGRGRWREGPRLEVAAAGRNLAYDGRPLGRLRTRAHWQPGQLVLEDLAWDQAAGLSATGRAVLRGDVAAPDLALDARVVVLPDELPALRGLLVDSTRATLDLVLSARGRDGRWRLGAVRAAGDLSRKGRRALAVSGHITPGQVWDGRLPEGRLDLALPDGAPVGSLELLDGAAPRWQARVTVRPAVLALLALPASVPGDLEGELSLEGEGGRTAARADLRLRGRRALVDGRLAWTDTLRTLGADLVLEGWRGSRLAGQVEARLAGRRLEVPALRLENLELGGWVDFDSRRYLAEAGADNLELRPLWDLLAEGEPPAELGSLSLLAAGEGSLDSLGLRGGVEWRLRVRDRQARLRADLDLDRARARLERGRLSLDGREWATLDCFWSLDQGPRELTLQVQERDLAELAPASGGGPPLLEGMVSEGILRADLRQPAGRGVEGHLHVRRPRVGGVPFERLDVGISKGEVAGRLALDSLVLFRGGAAPLRVDLRGALPMGDGDMDLELDMAGDLLRPLSLDAAGRPSAFFREAAGAGRFTLRLGGTPAEPQLREGRLDLEGGRLEMASVFRRVRDLEVRLEIQNGRLLIERCQAAVDNARLRISNTWEAAADGRPLESLVLERPELDCGVLVLETLDRRGLPGPVEVNVPGLMEPDWSGRVTLKGAAEGERCWLAGPVDRPVVRGLALADNAEFTFPFIKGETAPTPLLAATIAMLNSVDWDVQVLGGRNVNYYRQVQGFDDLPVMDRLTGFLDRITVDVFLDPMDRPLRFTGQVDDESFRVLGEVRSTRGSVLILDREFEVEEAGMSFDASSLLPVVWGRAGQAGRDAGSDPGSWQSPVAEDADQIWVQFTAVDELGNTQPRGRWDEIKVMLVGGDGAAGVAGGVPERGQEQLLVDMGLNPHDPAASIETMLPDVVAGFWEIPLRPIESRLRRRLGLDEVRIQLPVLRNTVEELLSTQIDRQRLDQNYLGYLQGTRVTLGKVLGPRTFARWSGQLVASTPVAGRAEIRLFQRCNVDYEVSRNLSLTGELVFDPLREWGSIKGDPRLLLRYRQRY